MSDTNSRLVYSTASGFVPEPTAKAASASPFPDDGIVRLRRENKGRKGAGRSRAACSFPPRRGMLRW